jgi:hypothetical protein
VIGQRDCGDNVIHANTLPKGVGAVKLINKSRKRNQ